MVPACRAQGSSSPGTSLGDEIEDGGAVWLEGAHYHFPLLRRKWSVGKEGGFLLMHRVGIGKIRFWRGDDRIMKVISLVEQKEDGLRREKEANGVIKRDQGWGYDWVLGRGLVVCEPVLLASGLGFVSER